MQSFAPPILTTERIKSDKVTLVVDLLDYNYLTLSQLNTPRFSGEWLGKHLPRVFPLSRDEM